MIPGRICGSAVAPRSVYGGRLMASDREAPTRSPGRSGRFTALLRLGAGMLLLLAALRSSADAVTASDGKPPKRRGTRGVAALLISALAIGVALLLYALRPADLWLGRYLPLALLALAAVITIGALARARVTLFGRLTAGFGAAAPWVPFIAAIATVSAMLVVPNADTATGRLVATGTGILLGLAGWGLLAGGMAYGNDPARVNSRVWADLNERFRTLSTRLDALDADRTSAAYLEARAHLDWMACIGVRDCTPEEPAAGPEADEAVVNWAQGYRYVDLLTALHRAEEAMLELLAEEQLEAEVMHDRLRLDGSVLEDLTSKVETIAARRKPAAEGGKEEKKREDQQDREPAPLDPIAVAGPHDHDDQLHGIPAPPACARSWSATHLDRRRRVLLPGWSAHRPVCSAED